MDWKGFVKRLDLPDGFSAPAELAFGDVRAKAISRADLDEDVRGINASIELIRRTRGGTWPTGPVTADNNYIDLVWHECEFRDGGSFTYALYDRSGLKLLNADTARYGRPVVLEEGLNSVTLTVEQLHLNPGTYVLGLWLAKRLGDVFDYIESAGELEVVARSDGTEVRPTWGGIVPCTFTFDVANRTAAESPAGRPRA